jgi:hypothetical protein
MTGQPLVPPAVPEALREARLDRHAWDRGIPLVAGGLDDQPADRLLRMLALTDWTGED